ncbi:helix-turn-helix domain-containing protein [Streptosporangium sp. NPDC048047]|uniref:helix-turn-helix domain-containing protein n=1 Tax=Streptosporangium sp. NPDC048047 TaxID=3155748 RepID=UPI003430B18F
MTAITARDLLNDPIFTGHQVLGGADGLDHVVRDAALVHTEADLSQLPPAAVAIIDINDSGGVSSQHLIESFCRRLYQLGGRMLVVVGRLEAVSLATIRLANRLALPVVALQLAAGPIRSAPAVAARVLAMTHNPDILYARALRTAAPRLARADTIDSILHIVGGILNAQAALVTAEGTIIAGQLHRARPTDVTRHPAAVVERVSGYILASCPVFGTDHTLWLACEASEGGPVWDEVARATLQTAVPAVAGWFTRERLRAERDSRRLHSLLAEILQLDRARRVPEHVASQAATAGITLDGWHMGIHVTWHDGRIHKNADDVSTATHLEHILTTQGIKVPVFTRADGWSLWVTSPVKPDSTRIHQLLTRLRQSLTIHNARSGDSDQLLMVGGVGQPAIGPSAIASSLTQAHQAAIAARSTGQPGAVEYIGDLGPERLLASWYTDPAFRANARQILGKLLTAPDSEELRETLLVYLNTGSSAIKTAQRLALHRNTVSKRITAIEELLGEPLSERNRMVVHLACLALKTENSGRERPPSGFQMTSLLS